MGVYFSNMVMCKPLQDPLERDQIIIKKQLRNLNESLESYRQKEKTLSTQLDQLRAEIKQLVKNKATKEQIRFKFTIYSSTNKMYKSVCDTYTRNNNAAGVIRNFWDNRTSMAQLMDIIKDCKSMIKENPVSKIDQLGIDMQDFGTDAHEIQETMATMDADIQGISGTSIDDELEEMMGDILRETDPNNLVSNPPRAMVAPKATVQVVNNNNSSNTTRSRKKAEDPTNASVDHDLPEIETKSIFEKDKKPLTS